MFPPYEYTAVITVKDVYDTNNPRIPDGEVAVAFRPAQKGDSYLSPCVRRTVRAEMNHPDSEPTIILATRYPKD